LILFAAVISFGLLPAQHAQSKNSASAAKKIHRHTVSSSVNPDGDSGGFIIVGTEDGATCRQMTVRESLQLQTDKPRTNLRTISESRTTNLQGQQGLKIILRGTQQLEAFPAAKDAFLRAAATWESIIQSPITVVIDVDFGPTLFGSPFSSPSVIGGTIPQPLLGEDEIDSLRSALIAGAQNAQQAEIFNALPTGALPTDIGLTGNIFGASSSFRAIGLIDPVADPDGEQSTLGSPPSIGFNSAFTFDFDPTNGIDSDKTDFDAVATHEIGHALGFLSGVGNKELSPSSRLALAPSVWDLFRFRPGALQSGSFTSTPRVQLAGGEHVFFVGDSELPLSTSTAAGTGGGDGRQPSHWKDNALIGTYTGVMDPTAGSGERLHITAADLTALNFFGYKTNPNTTVAEILSVDDGSREEALPLTNAIVVNRYTPARYPATLYSVRVQIPPTTDGSSPIDQPLRIVAFVDPNRTGTPPANPTLIVDKTVMVTDLGTNRFIEVLLTNPSGLKAQQNPPVITAGDLYVGIQSSSASVLIAGDRTGKQQKRSFVSTDNFASFGPLQNSGNVPLNFISRIVLTEKFGDLAAPALASISPSAVSPGGPAFTLYVQGSNFQTSSVVKWNGADRQTAFVSGTQLQAQITAADVANAGTASVTVNTPNAAESAALTLKIEANRPLPVITRLSPSGYAVISNSGITVDVFGLDFTPQTVVRFQGADRTTTFVNSTHLTVNIPTSDYSMSGDYKITAFTPSPGGGTSNEVNFPVINCSTTLSSTSLLFPSGSTTNPTASLTGGVILNSNGSVCPWNAVANAPWISLTNPTNGQGAGKSVISFLIEPNTNPAGRMSTISGNGFGSLNIRQLGRATSVSAANYAGTLAPNSIAAAFGVALAPGTQAATTQPLPTTLNNVNVLVVDARNISRLAQLFFVSEGQINFLVPEGTASGNAVVRTAINGIFVSDGVVPISAVAPALFTANSSGAGLAAAVLLRVKADNSQSFEPVTQFNSMTGTFVPVPIDFGAETDRLFLLLFGTGISGRSGLSAVSVQVGGTNAPVSYAGTQNDFAGLDQINAELSRSLIGKGEVPINLTVDGRAANAVTVTFK